MKPGWAPHPASPRAKWPAYRPSKPARWRRTTAGTVDLAYEVARSVNFDRDELGDRDSMELEVLRLAADLRREEQSLVIGSIIEASASNQHEATETGVRAAVTLLRDTPPSAEVCHLLSSDADLCSNAKERGHVEDAFHVTNLLTPAHRGLVIPTVNGPVVERIVDDMTLTTRIRDSGDLEVTLVQRFFLLRPNVAVRLV